MNTSNRRTSRLADKARKRIAISSVLLAMAVFVGISDAGIGRLGITRGHIARFGSIFVNNREIDISTAAITIDGHAATEADLRLGQVAFVRGVFDDELPVGTAVEVELQDNVEGPISHIDVDDDLILVLGQTIESNFETVFDLFSGENDIDGLSVNDQIQVSGFLAAGGNILASRIEQTASTELHEVSGTVSALTETTFAINALTVDIRGAVFVDFPSGFVADGDVVEVKGSDLGAAGELIALQVEWQPGIAGVAGEVGEFEGLITDFDSATQFSIAEVAVSTDPDTLFFGGGPANLTANTSIEVGGEFGTDGVLAADRVTIRGTRIHVQGQVDSVSATSLTVLGITATTDSTTRMEDNSSASLESFGLSDLYSGDHVELRSFRNPPASTPFLAARVKRENPNSNVRLQGFMTSVSARHFDLLGVTIEVDPDTDYLDAGGKPITEDEFFAARLTEGTFAVVHGAEITVTGILADQVELQLDD